MGPWPDVAPVNEGVFAGALKPASEFAGVVRAAVAGEAPIADQLSTCDDEGAVEDGGSAELVAEINKSEEGEAELDDDDDDEDCPVDMLKRLPAANWLWPVVVVICAGEWLELRELLAVQPLGDWCKRLGLPVALVCVAAAVDDDEDGLLLIRVEPPGD